MCSLMFRLSFAPLPAFIQIVVQPFQFRHSQLYISPIRSVGPLRFFPSVFECVCGCTSIVACNMLTPLAFVHSCMRNVNRSELLTTKVILSKGSLTRMRIHSLLILSQWFKTLCFSKCDTHICRGTLLFSVLSVVIDGVKEFKTPHMICCMSIWRQLGLRNSNGPGYWPAKDIISPVSSICGVYINISYL